MRSVRIVFVTVLRSGEKVAWRWYTMGMPGLEPIICDFKAKSLPIFHSASSLWYQEQRVNLQKVM